ncbi:MAG: DMT family transporter [Azoarcus sp.]|nr:DMT family transporter [Azoarcus sp.]
MNRDRLIGALYVTLSAASFGAMAIFARYAYASGADVVAVLFLRFMLAGLLLTGVMLMGRRRWPRGRNLLVLVLMGGLGYVAQSYSFFAALNYASAGLVALLLYLYPFLVTVFGALLWRRRLSAGRISAVLAALVGTALTLGGGIDGQPLGIALGITAALIYSVYVLAGSQVLDKEEPLAAATVVMLSAAVVFGGFALVNAPSWPAGVSGWVSVSAIALVSTVIAMVGFFAGMKRLGAADAATLSTLEPVVTFVLAAIFLSEPLRANQLLGGAIILGAVIWLTRTGAASGAGAPKLGDQAAVSGVSGRNSAS